MNTPAKAGRPAYHAPVLRDHGTVAELTLMFNGDWDGGGYYPGYPGGSNPTS